MGLYFPGLIYFMLKNTNNVTVGKYDAREHASGQEISAFGGTKDTKV